MFISLWIVNSINIINIIVNILLLFFVFRWSIQIVIAWETYKSLKHVYLRMTKYLYDTIAVGNEMNNSKWKRFA